MLGIRLFPVGSTGGHFIEQWKTIVFTSLAYGLSLVSMLKTIALLRTSVFLLVETLKEVRVALKEDSRFGITIMDSVTALWTF